MKSMARDLQVVSGPTQACRGYRECTHAQTWDPISGITVNRTVSSLRRTHAIFSREDRAAVSSKEAGSVSCLLRVGSTDTLGRSTLHGGL